MRRSALVCLVALGLSSVLVGCGDGSEQALTFRLDADEGSSAFAAPAEASSGLTEITLENEGELEGDLQLIRAEGEHSLGAVLRSFSKSRVRQPVADWYSVAGGVGTTPPGESRTVTQVLEPGTYYAINTKERQGPSPEAVASFVVNGGGGGAVDADARIRAFEYGFEVRGLTSGDAAIAFENAGAQPHQIVAAPLGDRATAADVEDYFRTEEGSAPPYDYDAFRTAAVIQGGEEQLLTLDLKPGRYVLFCFISDRRGGLPHALRGMVDEIEVR